MKMQRSIKLFEKDKQAMEEIINEFEEVKRNFELVSNQLTARCLVDDEINEVEQAMNRCISSAKQKYEDLQDVTIEYEAEDEQALANQIDDNPMVDFVKELERVGVLNIQALPLQDLHDRYIKWLANENKEDFSFKSARSFVAPIAELLSDYGYARAEDGRYDRRTPSALDATNDSDIELYAALMRSIDLDEETANSKQVILYKKN